MFNDNYATGGGGAVYGRAEFVKCSFIGNAVMTGEDLGRKYAEISGRDYTSEKSKWDYGSGGNGGAVNGGGYFKDCTFQGNRAHSNYRWTHEWHGASKGGAVSGDGIFENCTFDNNGAGMGCAVSGTGTYVKSAFSNNNASFYGGAVSGGGTFVNSAFTKNKVSKGTGGGVDGDGVFVNCTFSENQIAERSYFHEEEGPDRLEGGAIYGEGKIVNSIFYKNIAAGRDNDITVNGSMEIDYSVINYLKGAANFGDRNIMGDPKFVDPDNGDLHLRPDSPAINTGKIVPELKDTSTDLDG